MKTNPDVIRKHARVPRSYREATGQFYSYKEPFQYETWLWRIVICAGYVVCVLLFLGVWQ